jgi:hypothetical protein
VKPLPWLLMELWRQWLRLLWLVVLVVAFVVCAWRVIVVRERSDDERYK